MGPEAGGGDVVGEAEELLGERGEVGSLTVVEHLVRAANGDLDGLRGGGGAGEGEDGAVGKPHFMEVHARAAGNVAVAGSGVGSGFMQLQHAIHFGSAVCGLMELAQVAQQGENLLQPNAEELAIGVEALLREGGMQRFLERSAIFCSTGVFAHKLEGHGGVVKLAHAVLHRGSDGSPNLENSGHCGIGQYINYPLRTHWLYIAACHTRSCYSI